MDNIFDFAILDGVCSGYVRMLSSTKMFQTC